MHTIVWGLLLVLVAYAAQTTVVGLLFGGWWAALYLLSLPPAATWDLRYRDRLSRAFRRMRTWLMFRREPELQRQMTQELVVMRREAALIARLVEEIGGRSRAAGGSGR